MELLTLLQERLLCCDGGFGTALFKKGLGAGELSERWNVSHPQDVVEIHRSFLDAGADIILANTFGANVYHYDEEEMEQVIRAGIACAKQAVAESKKEAFVALDIGSTGKLLPPMGSLPFDEAVESFAKMVRIGADAGADLVWIETMNDVYELKAAVVAARENCDLPVFATAVYDANARMLTGTSPESVVAMLEGLGVAALGLNCGIGPDAAKTAVKVLSDYASVPLIVKPNAGLPHVVDGVTCFDVEPEDFAASMEEIMCYPGVRIVGGCCGTTPEHVRAAWERVSALPLTPVTQKEHSLLASSQLCMDLSDEVPEIGMSICAQTDEELLGDLQDGMIDTALDLADDDIDEGAEILNLALAGPDVEEAERTKETIMEIQNLNMQPFSIQSTDPDTIRAALRTVNGKAMINLTGANPDEIKSVLPVIKKYGALILVSSDQYETACILAEEAGINKKELVCK